MHTMCIQTLISYVPLVATHALHIILKGQYSMVDERMYMWLCRELMYVWMYVQLFILCKAEGREAYLVCVLCGNAILHNFFVL